MKEDDIMKEADLQFLAKQSLADQGKEITPGNNSIAIVDVTDYLTDILSLPEKKGFEHQEYNNMRNLSIEEAGKVLGFPITSLREHNINTFADLLQTSLFDILRLPSIGAKGAEKIRYALEKNGFCLAKKFPHNIVPDDFILENLLLTLYPSKVVQKLKKQGTITYGQYKEIRDTLSSPQKAAIDQLIKKFRKD